MTRSTSRVAVVGLVGGECFGAAARAAIARASVVVGSARQLGHMALAGSVERVELRGPLEPLVDEVATRAGAGAAVCVVASGDPGFFGIVRVLSERLGPDTLDVHPAPSSVALAFARLGTSWDDAVVVSAHGRSLTDAVDAARRETKVAILTAPDHPPELLGKALLDAGCGPRVVAVASRIGEHDERFARTNLAGLASGSFDPMSVVVLVVPARSPRRAGLAWGLPEREFAHRDGMITKSEVRAVVLGKLALPPTGVLWDVGAGSGSIGIECARLSPGLRVIAIERAPADAERIRENARSHGVAVDVVEGEAPGALASLPDPDRVFIGGGGVEVLDAALARLSRDGVAVATYVVLDRAVTAAARLGNLVQLGVARGTAVGGAGLRLAAENPVFVAWGRGE